MTEAAYKAAQRLMRKINHLRGLITKQKATVGYWTTIVAENEAHGRSTEKPKKVLENTLEKLRKLQQAFADLQFPDPNLKEENRAVNCEICGAPTQKEQYYCEECLQTHFINPNEEERNPFKQEGKTKKHQGLDDL